MGYHLQHKNEKKQITVSRSLLLNNNLERALFEPVALSLAVVESSAVESATESSELASLEV